MLYSDLEKLYNLPFFELLQKARRIHEEHWTDSSVQLCTLLSIKTGGCSEDCSYCAQSARYSSGVAAERLMEKNEVNGKYYNFFLDNFVSAFTTPQCIHSNFWAVTTP